MLRAPVWRQLTRGVWIHAELPVNRNIWRDAARLVMPSDALLCGLSAATDWGADVRALGDVVVHVGLPDQSRRARHGIEIHQLTVQPGEVRRGGDWLVTSPARTALDCARWLSLMQTVVVIDALMRTTRLSYSDLAQIADRHRGEKGSAALRRASEMADDGAESPMESRQRVTLIQGGLPRPRSQYEVFDHDGRFVARLDLAYAEQFVAVEFDGALHWAQRRSDDRRRDALRALGWTILVFSADDIYHAPDRVVSLVTAALARSSR